MESSGVRLFHVMAVLTVMTRRCFIRSNLRRLVIKGATPRFGSCFLLV